MNRICLSVLFLLSPAVNGLAQSPLSPVKSPVTGPSVRQIAGHIAPLVRSSRLLGALNGDTPVRMAILLPHRNLAARDAFLQNLYTPGTPEFHHFLTPEAFTERFGPTQADYDAVAAYAKSAGLTIVGTHTNRTILDVTAPAQTVNRAFRLNLNRYQSPTGRVFHAPDSEPSLPVEIANRVSGIVGLNNAAVLRPHLLATPLKVSGNGFAPNSSPFGGSGLAGYYGPKDIKTAYGLANTTLTGAGQTLGLVEYDGYVASDIAHYEDYYGLPHVPLQNTLIDGYDGSAGGSSIEVALDIELMAGTAPGVNKIIVYEAPNADYAIVDLYDQIIADNQAKSISISWGAWENAFALSTVQGENTAFIQMAAQGQTVYAASGDAGDQSYSYTDNSGNDHYTFGVDDPAVQPYVTGVGGTTLYMNGAGVSYQSERAWGGSGGGISTIWPLPLYQQGPAVTGAAASTMFRNVPDVALNADPGTPYTMYFTNGSNGPNWYIVGGTSCAAPEWAAFTALVNQQRAMNGTGPIGFANPVLYAAGKLKAASDYFDITSGSNGAYTAVAGRDDVTGWGSFNGGNLLADLASNPVVSGTIALEGVSDLSAVSSGAPLGLFTLSFRTPGTTNQIMGAPVALTTTAHNANGTYTLSGVFPGTYDVAIKGSKNLAVLLPGVTIGSRAATLPGVLLPAGDANGDNVVDTSDFNALAGAYGSVYDPTDPTNSSGYDPTVDFDYNGLVDTADFNLLVGDFGNAGAN